MNQKHYEGKPCPLCGSTLYYKTGNQCVSCQIKRSRERYHRLKNDSDYIKSHREYDKIYREKNPEKIKKKMEKYNRHYYLTVTKPKRQRMKEC
jgi:uncharacterized Zn finger protein (UPF0148 family)